MKKVLLDTNFLLIPGQYGVDVLSEIERLMYDQYVLVVLDLTLLELETIQSEQKSKHKRAARLGRELVEKNNMELLDTREFQKQINSDHADDVMVALAKQEKNMVVATQDKGLKARLQKENIPLLVLRGKTHVVLL